MRIKKNIKIIDKTNRYVLMRKILSDFTESYFVNAKNKINILEAGCGNYWNMDLNSINYELTGVDLSREALFERMYVKKDLDKVIHADLRNVYLPPSHFDAVYCSYVLEHISGAEQVLDRLFDCLKPSGIILLIIPDRYTVKGFITRVTPHWFHVLYYKHIKNDQKAGLPGNLPFPTYYDKIVSREGIQNYCEKNNHIIHLEYGDNPDISAAFGVFAPLLKFVFKLIELFSFNLITNDYIGLIYAIEKTSTDSNHSYS